MILTLDFQGQILKTYTGMGGPIDMEQKGCETIRSQTKLFVTHPWPWPWILKVKFKKKTVSQEWEGQYGPVTIIVPASGHLVRCIPWVQMGTFNKEISFLCGLKFFALNIFCWEYL